MEKIDKIKKISKYVMNILAMINALIVGLSPIWGWDSGKIVDTIVVIGGVIGLYLVGGKLFEVREEILTEKIGSDE
jgi:hypothetical protein